MEKANVYFSPVSTNQPKTISETAKSLLAYAVSEESIRFVKNLPIKVHSGESGNDTFIKPALYDGVIDYLEENDVSPYFIETNVSYDGPRALEKTHCEMAKSHGFTRIPFVIGDEDGFGHTEVPIQNGKHFKTCKIANKLANQPQVLVMSHFKGHCMAGFGAAIKMLGIGFASGRGKSESHSSTIVPQGKQIDWSNAQMGKNENGIIWNPDVVYSGDSFLERMTEYALAASHGKHHVYMTYAINITADCDCDGHHMDFVYDDLGLFVSLDPVAIDKAVMDILGEREGKIPFTGSSVFAYAEKLGMGTQHYTLHRLDK
jgi:uncharacterized protein